MQPLMLMQYSVHDSWAGRTVQDDEKAYICVANSWLHGVLEVIVLRCLPLPSPNLEQNLPSREPLQQILILVSVVRLVTASPLTPSCQFQQTQDISIRRHSAMFS